MDQFLNAALKEGEVVKWKGTPDPYRLLDEDNKKATITTWVIAIAIAAALSVLYTIYALTGGSVNFQPFVYVLTIGFPLILFIDPIRDMKHINKQLFAITDQRILIFHKNTSTENKALEFRLENIDAIRVDEIESGYSRIRICSPAFGLKPAKTRRSAITGMKDENDKLVAMVFYRLTNSDCDKVCSVLQEKAITIDKGRQ